MAFDCATVFRALEMRNSRKRFLAIAAFGTLGLFGNLLAGQTTSRSSDSLSAVGESIVGVANTLLCPTRVWHDADVGMFAGKRKESCLAVAWMVPTHVNQPCIQKCSNAVKPSPILPPSHSKQQRITMARSGLAKGKNPGHVTQQRDLKPKPSYRKGVSDRQSKFAILSLTHGLRSFRDSESEWP